VFIILIKHNITAGRAAAVAAIVAAVGTIGGDILRQQANSLKVENPIGIGDIAIPMGFLEVPLWD
jgi:hypothetical protein